METTLGKKMKFKNVQHSLPMERATCAYRIGTLVLTYKSPNEVKYRAVVALSKRKL